MVKRFFKKIGDFYLQKYIALYGNMLQNGINPII